MNKIEPWLHRLAIVGVIWLFATADWVRMANRIPVSATVWDWAHIVIGVLTTLVGAAFLRHCCRHGQWRQYFPYLVGDLKPTLSDLAGLFRGRLPRAGGSGLLAFIEGLGLLLLLAVGITGIGWLLTQGSSDAFFWRKQHLFAASGLLGFLVVHAVAALISVVDLIRDA
ncbi:cytochrome b/b6 domain-containing protein [Ferrimonas balearica]|uniref:cytochrome b/b6 domain-containing protein n=1 Tax=Ferrimonas balearica TaxID=44012 RepID=UPI001C9945C6|nr:cytochrome b/b6 domain-containing protein [Ferrimonas balearica]MBY5920628.1 cytochrome b/b6 domain-containing protein [Ferrimonas balearica]MBY5996687.1 cytochrome b/b6 domain-containing protein [Ferrimonas balearica]